jgi:hypothetical protein
MLHLSIGAARPLVRRVRAAGRAAVRRGHWLALALFAVLVSLQYSSATPVRAPVGVPEAHGDGLYYYAYLRSLAFDHDVRLENDYQLLGDQFHAGINPLTKRAQNVFTIGPALFWMPFVPLAHALEARHQLQVPETRAPNILNLRSCSGLTTLYGLQVLDCGHAA